MIKELQEKILQLKQEKGAIIAAHSYIDKEILEIADVKGDSFVLSVEAAKSHAKWVILCGVHFMAEGIKLLSPDKKVTIVREDCGCAMADMVPPEYIREYKAAHKDSIAMCYINTTAAVKAECDVCVTSSSALKIAQQYKGKNILFVPDKNLGGFINDNAGLDMSLCDGCCPVHDEVTISDVLAAKLAHPNALLLVHPECRKEVADAADYVGSTAGIMEFARQTEADELIIGTEISIADHLAYELPGKKIHILSKKLICPDMRITRLIDVYNTLNGTGGLDIELDKATEQKARACIEKMIELG